MAKILKNTVIIEKRNGDTVFLGEVVKDSRFETGHRICTSKIISWNAETRKGITESGTEYEIENLIDLKDYPDFLKEKYSEKEALLFLDYISTFIK